MMELSVGADAGADADTEDPSFSAFAKLAVSLDSLTSELQQARRMEQERLAHLPNHVVFEQGFNNTIGAATSAVLDFGGPQPGREWVVRLFNAYAVPLAANATVVTWYVGQNIPSGTPGQPAASPRWQFASVPGQQSYTSDVIHVKPGQKVLAGLTGIPATSQLILTLTVNDQLLYDVRRISSK
jgi:hypothetical protein